MLRQLPNLISIARLLSTPVLAWLAFQRLIDSFAWLLLAANITDIIDGWLARKLGCTSQIGALLDSIADVLLLVVTLFAIWHLHRYVFTEHGRILLVFGVTWICVHCSAFYRYRMLASFHTLLTQIAIVVFGIFALVLFFFEFFIWLWFLAGILGILAGIENLIMIAMLPNWSPDIRGGLYTILRNRTDNN